MNADVAPDLSVVVTVVEGEPALTRCLDALASQAGAPDLEVLVPYDASLAELIDGLEPRYPAVRFVPMGTIARDQSRNAFDAHGLYERRRAAGLRASTGRFVALLEDRGWPRPDWAEQMIDLHTRLPYGAIGGVVDHGGRGALRWALFYCDFGRYQRSVSEGPAEFLSDVNICYKREALDAVRPLWEKVYQESTVNWALKRAGAGLHLSRAPVVVEQRAEARLWPVMRERLHWARIFAHVRGRETPSVGTCLAWSAATALLPALLFARHLRREIGPRGAPLAFLKAAPATLLLLHCWSLGECVGYLEAAGAKAAGGRSARA